MIYLACPYSHDDPAVRVKRFETATAFAASLMRQGKQVFSPISHSHPMTKYGLPGDWEFWGTFDRAFLEMCSEMIVLRLDGWEESVGIKAEIDIMRGLGKPVSFTDPIF